MQNNTKKDLLFLAYKIKYGLLNRNCQSEIFLNVN
jgi:hypothetical protein